MTFNLSEEVTGCKKCGGQNFEHDSYWDEYICENCGWASEEKPKGKVMIREPQKKENGTEQVDLTATRKNNQDAKNLGAESATSDPANTQPQSGEDKLCPKCQSTDIEVESKKGQNIIRGFIGFIIAGFAANLARHFLHLSFVITGVVFMIVMLLAQTFPIQAKAHCKGCSHVWKKTV